MTGDAAHFAGHLFRESPGAVYLMFMVLISLEKPSEAGDLMITTCLAAGRGEWTPTDTPLPSLSTGIIVHGVESWVNRLHQDVVT